MVILSIIMRGMEEGDIAQIFDCSHAVICLPEDESMNCRLGELDRTRMRLLLKRKKNLILVN